MEPRILRHVVAIVVLSAGLSISQDTLGVRRDQVVTLDVRQCRQLSAAKKDWLNTEWAAFRKVAIECPVERTPGKPLLYIISIDWYRLVTDLPYPTVEPKLPRPIIVSPTGTHLGTLPYVFPSEDSLSLDVSFTDWINDFPGTVNLYLEDIAVGGDHQLPSLKWDQKLKLYTSKLYHN